MGLQQVRNDWEAFVVEDLEPYRKKLKEEIVRYRLDSFFGFVCICVFLLSLFIFDLSLSHGDSL